MGTLAARNSEAITKEHGTEVKALSVDVEKNFYLLSETSLDTLKAPMTAIHLPDQKPPRPTTYCRAKVQNPPGCFTETRTCNAEIPLGQELCQACRERLTVKEQK